MVYLLDPDLEEKYNLAKKKSFTAIHPYERFDAEREASFVFIEQKHRNWYKIEKKWEDSENELKFKRILESEKSTKKYYEDL